MRASALLILSAALFIPSVPVSADPTTPAKPQLICRSAQKAIGSRIRKPRKCMTAEQWREADEDAERVPLTMRVGTARNEGKQRGQ
ncbi:MAG TPA: hypothetical protein VIT45_16570 [Allosphingosinicella sp.]